MLMYTELTHGEVLISQVWREQNTEINVHLFENASDMRKKTSLKNIK